MKRVFRLVRLEFLQQAAMLALTLAIVAVVQAILVFLKLGEASSLLPLRFESLVEASGVPVVFVLAILVLASLTSFSVLRGYMHTKSIYALLTLPINRHWVYLAKLLATLVSFFCLWSLQLLLILVFHGAYAARFSDVLPKGSLYISFLRSGFLRTFFPPHPISAATTLLLLFSLAAFVLTSTIHLRAGRLWRLLSPLAAGVLYWARLFPLLRHSPEVELLKLFSACMIIFLCALPGIQAMKRGEVDA